MILQYPIYGGILGMLNATGLAGVIAKVFVANASAHTLPFWSYTCARSSSPSWYRRAAVIGRCKGPSSCPPRCSSAPPLPATAMAVAAGENVAYMLQPFFALPVVAMAGIGIQRVLGYTVVTFAVTFLIWVGATLFLM